MTNPIQTLRFFNELANLFSDIAARVWAFDANDLAQQHRNRLINRAARNDTSSPFAPLKEFGNRYG